MEYREEVIVRWNLGLHIRPATKIARILQSFSCVVTFGKNNKFCNAKSVIQLITLEAAPGDRISIIAQGEKSKEAVETLKHFFDNDEDKEEDETIPEDNNRGLW